MQGERIADVIFILIIAAIIYLKLTGIITISWLWLFSPILILLGMGFMLAFGILILYIGATLFERRKK